MTALTDAEQAFLTMAKMAGQDVDRWAEQELKLPIHTSALSPWFSLDDQDSWVIDKPMLGAAILGNARKRLDFFPIVASTFEALTIERPELRPHYDRAREAWEASQ